MAQGLWVEGYEVLQRLHLRWDHAEFPPKVVGFPTFHPGKTPPFSQATQGKARKTPHISLEKHTPANKPLDPRKPGSDCQPAEKVRHVRIKIKALKAVWRLDGLQIADKVAGRNMLQGRPVLRVRHVALSRWPDLGPRNLDNCQAVRRIFLDVWKPARCSIFGDSGIRMFRISKPSSQQVRPPSGKNLCLIRSHTVFRFSVLAANALGLPAPAFDHPCQPQHAQPEPPSPCERATKHSVDPVTNATGEDL